MSLKGTKTANNLMISFANEAQAVMRYTYYAKVAKKEGYVQIQNIFEETARNEEVHAKRFYKFLKEDLQGEALNVNWDYPVSFSDTASNLMASVQGEHEEFVTMYPKFADIAQEEGFPEIAAAWRFIAKVESAHENRFQKLYDNIMEQKVFERDEVMLWKCNKCGYVHEGNSAPKVCPACHHPVDYFEIFKETY